jgi:hypothetical protein
MNESHVYLPSGDSRRKALPHRDSPQPSYGPAANPPRHGSPDLAEPEPGPTRGDGLQPAPLSEPQQLLICNVKSAS